LVGITKSFRQEHVDSMGFLEPILHGHGLLGLYLRLEILDTATGKRLVRSRTMILFLGGIPFGKQILQITVQQRIKIMMAVELVDVAYAGKVNGHRLTAPIHLQKPPQAVDKVHPRLPGIVLTSPVSAC